MTQTAEEYKKEIIHLLMQQLAHYTPRTVRNRVEQLLEIEVRAAEKCRNKSFGEEVCPRCEWHHE